jgi:Zn-dependent peptidase ImmA (M78 family)/transcriptional regulator with XRE-family HTH domain
MFSPSRLRLARERHGWTKKELAEHLGVSTRSVVGWEAGDKEPSPETLELFERALGYPTAFFMAGEVDALNADAVSFRALSKMTARERDQALAAGTLAFGLSGWIDSQFHLPKPDVPDLSTLTAEMAADTVRQSWRLGSGPLGNTVHLVESHGVRVFSIPINILRVDAFSGWRQETPLIFLNTRKSGEHGRFDVAHELGHLILHRMIVTARNKAYETAADRFASALLMPSSSIYARHRSRITLSDVLREKQFWGVSAMAYTHRLHDLRLLSDWHYRSFCIELSKTGYRGAEPGGIPRESSQLLNKVFQSLRERRIGREQMLAEAGVGTEDLPELVFGLALQDLGSGSAKGSRSLGDLRLVDG